VELLYRRHRFPPVVIHHAVWLYLRFPLSYRDVEDLLAERGLDISYETVRSWVLKFGLAIARRLRRRRPRPSNRWHLGEMVVRIAGERMYVWRAVNHEGEVLDRLVQRRGDTGAALRLMCKLLLDVMTGQPGEPKNLVRPVDHHVGGGVFLEGMVGALVDTATEDLSGCDAGARVRRSRAEHAGG
jgi:transposase-like protein